MKIHRYAIICPLWLLSLHCHDAGEVAAPAVTISSDADLVDFFTRQQPYRYYRLFPDVDSIVAGTLNGSHAHQPLVRVSMNDMAFNALSSGGLPPGSVFPDGSLIVKEIREGGRTALFAVMYKDRHNPISGQSWLWAEYEPDETVLVSIRSRGSGCIGCHSLEGGIQNDLVRTFERQDP